jgi:hypothetical protein
MEELVTSAAAHQKQALRGLIQEPNISKRREAIPRGQSRAGLKSRAG